MSFNAQRRSSKNYPPCRPHVNGLAVTGFVENFWCDISKATSQRMQLFVGVVQVFST